MYTARKIPLRIIFPFAWKPVLIFITYSSAVYVLHAFLGWTHLTLPFLPITLIGTAVAFFIGFKNNSSYERLWEGRRIWGAIVNASRTWGVQTIDFIHHSPGEVSKAADTVAAHREIIYRHLAYINALRSQLRRKTVWEEHRPEIDILNKIGDFHTTHVETELKKFLSEEEARRLSKHANPATQLLKLQSKRLRELHNAGLIDNFRHIEMMKLITEFYNQQGACERIKTFPFPRQWAFFSSVFIYIFIALLPFGLLHEFAKMEGCYTWLVIPFTTLIAWVFNTMEVIGDSSENPFENGINDVPMTAICRTIEIDLREMLGETDLPPRIQAIDHILL
jgi:ion channel-forming bestrophin family protein